GTHRETHWKLTEDIESLLGVHQEFAEGIKDFPGVCQKLAEGIESLLGVRQTKMIGSLPRWRREFAGRRPRDLLEDHQGLSKSLSGRWLYFRGPGIRTAGDGYTAQAGGCCWETYSGDIVYPCIPDLNGEDEVGQVSSSLAVSTRWISTAQLLQSDLATLGRGREENRSG
ncbi:hypothetical protein B296_00047040, partial [Ensete ventricosum]